MDARSVYTIALIGSFRRHASEINATSELARGAGWTVSSPRSSVAPAGAEQFVRLDSDPTERDNATVQSVALHRILGADIVYVVNVDGYVGRTTCYEIGRIVQARRPLYFLAPPLDLPIEVPATAIGTLDQLLAGFGDGALPTWWGVGDSEGRRLERSLLDHDYLDV